MLKPPPVSYEANTTIVAGLPTRKAFDMGVGFLGVGFLGTILSWFFLIYFGRRIIYNSGLGLLAVLQIVIGILDCVPNYIDRPGVIWTQSSLMVIWNFFYDLVSRSPYHLPLQSQMLR